MKTRKARRRKVRLGSSTAVHHAAARHDMESARSSLKTAEGALDKNDCNKTAHWLMSAQFYRGRLDAQAYGMARGAESIRLVQLTLDRTFNEIRHRFNARCAR